MLTIFIFSSTCRNRRAIVKFSSFCVLIVGRLLYLWNFFPAKTSIRAISRRPSDRSVSRSAMFRLTVLRCSFAHRVKVFFWISFHWASLASSRSVVVTSDPLESVDGLGSCARLTKDESLRCDMIWTSILQRSAGMQRCTVNDKRKQDVSLDD